MKRGRGAQRGRGGRSDNNSDENTANAMRTGSGRGRGSGTQSPFATNGDRPAQQMYTPAGRGGSGRGGRDGNRMRSASPAGGIFGSANKDSTPATPQSTFGGPNSTPFPAHEYAKRLQYMRDQRPKLRAKFIRERRMNPDGQMRLSDSVALVGLCTDKCPEFERVRRIVELDVKAPECTPETQHLPRRDRIPDETRMAKAYHRSAAGMDVELVSEIRSPKTCLDTVNYLMRRLDEDDFDFLHGWIWDRTRSISKDLRTQSIKSRSDIAIYLQCLERTARFLLVSTHQMARSSREDYSHQQDIEQLNATLTSLKERYNDNRRINEISENEAEFVAYRLILAPIYTASELDHELHALPAHVQNNPRVRIAIEIYRLTKSIIFIRGNRLLEMQANWKRLWTLIQSPSVSYVMACAAEVSFQRVRHTVLDTLWRAYRIGTPSKPRTMDCWTTDKVKEVLGADTHAEAVNFCEAFGFEFSVNAAGQTFLDICKKGYARTPLHRPVEMKPQTFSQRFVESKRYNRPLSAIIFGQSVGQAVGAVQWNPTSNVYAEPDNSLFVPETAAAPVNVFQKAKGSGSSGNKFNAAANPFVPSTTPVPASSQAQSNPFLKAMPPAAEPLSSTSNPFLKAASPAGPPAAASNPFMKAQASTPTTQPSVPHQSNIFLKAQSSAQPSTTSQPNPFIPPALPVQPPATSQENFFTKAQSSSALDAVPKTAQAPSTVFDFAKAAQGKGGPSLPSSSPAASNMFLQAANPPQPQQAPSTSTSLFQPPAATASGGQISFTPTGSPNQSVIDTGADQKRLEEEKALQARLAQETAERQRREAAAEQARQAQEAAEKQRRDAEHQRLLRQQEQERAVKARQDQQRREEEARQAKTQRRALLWDEFTNELMHGGAQQSLLVLFLSEATKDMVKQVVREQKEAMELEMWTKKEQWAEEKCREFELNKKRALMGAWFQKLEKKKKARRAHERRQRVKELRARAAEERQTELHATGAELAKSARKEEANGLNPKDTNISNSQEQVTSNLKKATPQQAVVPNVERPAPSTNSRRARRTEQRRGMGTTTNATASTGKIALTPDSSVNGSVSAPNHSGNYHKTDRAPIDRTETDWFALRAQGLDPRKFRKRSFSWSSSDEEKSKLEVKRPKVTPSHLHTRQEPSEIEEAPLEPALISPAPTKEDEQRAKFLALQQSLRRSGSNMVQPTAPATTSMFAPSQSLINKARQLIQGSPSADVQHDFRRSVPNFGASASIGHKSAQSMSGLDKSRNDRAAYWARESRFVPKHLYGQGRDAVSTWRQQSGLSSPANSRSVSAQPLDLSSPVPMQHAFIPSAGLAHGLQFHDNQTDNVGALANYNNTNNTKTADLLYHDEHEEIDEVEPRQINQHMYGEVVDESEEDTESEQHNSYVNGDSGQYTYNQTSGYQQTTRNGEQYGQAELLDYEEEYTGDEEEVQSGEEEMEDYDEDEELSYDEEDEGESEEEDEPQQQPYHHVQPAQQSSKFAPQQAQPGATQDDAIELSD